MSDLKVRATLDGTNFAGGLSKLGFLTDGLKSRLAGAFTVGAIGMGVRKIMDYADAVEEGAARVDISTKALQEWSFAAKQNGADADKLITFIERLTKASQDLKNSSAFRAIGIDPGTMGPEELFRSVQSQTRGKGGSEIRSIIQGLGVEFRAIGPMVNTLGADLDEAGQSARKMGAVIDDATLHALAAMNDQLSIVSQVLMANFAPAVLEAGIALIRAVGWIRASREWTKDVGVNVGRQAGENVIEKGVVGAVLGWLGDPKNTGKMIGSSATPEAGEKFNSTMAAFAEMIDKIRNYKPTPPSGGGDDVGSLAARQPRQQSDSLVSVGNFLGAGRGVVESLQREQVRIAKANLRVNEETRDAVKAGQTGGSIIVP